MRTIIVRNGGQWGNHAITVRNGEGWGQRAVCELSSTAYASRRNVNEGNYDYFRYWENRSLGVLEDILLILQNSKTPKL